MAEPMAQGERDTPADSQHDERAEQDRLLGQFAAILAAAAIRLLQNSRQ